MLKNLVLRHLKNAFGWSTSRRIIVFEVDDYGAVRNASREARTALVSHGLDLERNRFDKFDALESAEDLEELFDVLSSFKDERGRHPVFTAMAIPANPDFEKIKEDRYEQYH